MRLKRLADHPRPFGRNQMAIDLNQGVRHNLLQSRIACRLLWAEAKMTNEAGQSDCRRHAAQWRQRACATERPELRAAYERIAESYETLSRQALLCRRLVSVIAGQRGELPRCCCDAAFDNDVSSIRAVVAE